MIDTTIKPERKLQVIRPDPAAIRYLKSRRHRRNAGFVILLFVVASAVACRWAVVGPAGDDWAKFDHKSFPATEVDRGVVVLKAVGRVRPVGVVIPTGEEAGAAEAKAWLSDQLIGKSVTVMVTGPQTRDPDGALRVRLYLEGAEDLALSAVKAGMVYVDRRGTDPFRPALAEAEADARKHERGLWAGLRFDQMPAWRQAWLRVRPK